MELAFKKTIISFTSRTEHDSRHGLAHWAQHGLAQLSQFLIPIQL